MAATKHWRHGWVPLDAYARNVLKQRADELAKQKGTKGNTRKRIGLAAQRGVTYSPAAALEDKLKAKRAAKRKAAGKGANNFDKAVATHAKVARAANWSPAAAVAHRVRKDMANRKDVKPPKPARPAKPVKVSRKQARSTAKAENAKTSQFIQDVTAADQADVAARTPAQTLAFDRKRQAHIEGKVHEWSQMNLPQIHVAVETSFKAAKDAEMNARIATTPAARRKWQKVYSTRALEHQFLMMVMVQTDLRGGRPLTTPGSPQPAVGTTGITIPK